MRTDGEPVVLRPVHLDYALYELLKNAMRAVVEHSGPAASMPAVNVHIAGSSEQITLRISDQARQLGSPYSGTTRSAIVREIVMMAAGVMQCAGWWDSGPPS